MNNRMYLVWELARRQKTYFYCEKHGSLMTEHFSEATILDSHEKIWEMAEDTKYGQFKVWQATGSEIFKWQMADKLPRERQ